METALKRIWHPARISTQTWRDLLSMVIGALWVYAALSKLADFDTTRQQMLNQVFPVWMAEILAWAVPLTELAIIPMLLYHPAQQVGLFSSLILLAAFSIYISITMTGIFGRIPCSCGGIIRNMGYWEHLFFNLFFVALSVIAIKLNYKRQEAPKGTQQKGGVVTTIKT